MRASFLLLVAGLGVLAAPGSVGAANREVEAFSYGFRAPYVRVDPGDTVTWRMGAGQESHTITSRTRVPERFDSDVKNPGETYSFTFSKPGRYEYLCELHTGLMFGSVQVGPDKERPAISRLRAREGAQRHRVLLTVSEDSRLRVRVAAAARPRKVLRRAATPFADGPVTVTVPKLAPGRYRVTVSARDREGNRSPAARTLLIVRG